MVVAGKRRDVCSRQSSQATPDVGRDGALHRWRGAGDADGAEGVLCRSPGEHGGSRIGRFSESGDFSVAETCDEVIVDHPNGLHKSVADR